MIIQPLTKTGKVISSKENFQSTQLYGQVHFMNRNRRRFDSVGCLHQVTPGVRDTYRSHRIAKLSLTIMIISDKL